MLSPLQFLLGAFLVSLQICDQNLVLGLFEDLAVVQDLVL